MPASRHLRHGLVAIGLVLLLAVWLKNAWVCDDAYINFRSLDQLRAGHGPVWNPHARVQVYTSVLWYWLQAPLYLLRADAYGNVLILSLVCLGGCLVALRRLVPDPAAWLLVVVLAVAARGYMDFTSSGLENPLLHLACLVLLDRYLAAAGADPGSPAAARPLRHLLLAAGWAPLVRHDLALLWLPPVLYAAWRHRRLWPAGTWLRVLAAAAAPLVLWTALAVVYYGSPWPNAALAKLGPDAPPAIVWRQGLLYLATMRFDPVLLAVIGAGLAIALRSARERPLAAGAVLYLGYLAAIGGDFMLGRLLGGVFLIGAVILARRLSASGPRAVAVATAAALAAAILLPVTPLNTPLSFAGEFYCDGVADERAHYGQATALRVRLRTPADRFPVHEWADRGRAAARRAEPLQEMTNVGFFGCCAGTETIVIDRFGIVDPLLARLPASAGGEPWRPGHSLRPVPQGYPQSLLEGGNRLADPALRRLYADIQLATAAPLAAHGRAGAIWRLLVRRR